MTEADWMRVWQEDGPAADPEKMARVIMARTWRFDQKVFWRNAREYAGGALALFVFAGLLVRGPDKMFAVIGLVAVTFVMAYLWWMHRGLQPLDPAADVAAYKTALLARYDDQIRLLRSVAYWYLLPLLLPSLWAAPKWWQKNPVGASVMLGTILVVFAAVGWLNMVAAVRFLRAARDKVESMFGGSEA